MDDKIFDDIIALVTKQTGIIPRESHKTGIKNFLDKRCKELNLATFADYYEYLNKKPNEFCFFINGATVNETYFFREEAQFTLLKEKILPELRKTAIGKPIRFWSAAASSGEEIYSLYLLATSMGLRTECFASDINTDVLEKCASGKYGANSVRALDGAKFQNLLSPYHDNEKNIVLPERITSKIERKQINLSKREAIFPTNVHIVFVRNVFIYFTLELRKQIIEKIVSTSLLPGGYMFVSMNETALLGNSILPKNLKKCSDGKIFYFQKTNE